MARKPNYKFEKFERERQKAAKKAAKKKAKLAAKSPDADDQATPANSRPASD